MRFQVLLMGIALYAVLYATPSDASETSNTCASVTHIVTVTATVAAVAVDHRSSNIASFPSPSIAISSLSTLTDHATVAKYITAYPKDTISTIPSAAGDSDFYYALVNGTTHWINGIAPPSSYKTRTTKTIQITVFPTGLPSFPTVTPSHLTTLQSSLRVITETAVSELVLTSTIILYLTRETALVSTASSRSEAGSVVPGPGPSGSNASSSLLSHSLYHTSSASAITTGETITFTRSVIANTEMSQTSALSSGVSSQALSTAGPGSTSVWSSTTPTTVSWALSSTLTKVFTNTTIGSLPTPSVCGEHGDFVLNWDDGPNFSPSQPITDPSDAPPVFNPYHHMYFSNGFVYVPPPRDPFPPISEPRLVMFLTNETGPSNNPDAGGQRSGQIGAGDRASESAFWFNAYSAYLGCDNEGPDECVMQISGYVWQDKTHAEVLAIQENVTLPACPGHQNCRLRQVKFAESMVGLSGIQVQAFVKDEQRMWYMDDLAMAWYDDTCAAGLLRIRSR